ncbi:MAG: NAD(P)H-dependent oxidoreductase subunit E [Candidatus Eremiobacteraeota bacterium]|nr:NAD(P)H-dependent oxidoreductase subunit E [Candidatus Eremiobacteraeota bacterium]
MTERDFPALLERVRPECERIVARYEQKRSALLMLAHVFQAHEGFVSTEAMHAIAEMLGVTPAETEGTISFYTLLYRRPVGKYMLQPCRGLACAINGAEDVMAYFREKLGVRHLETTPDGLFSYEEVECLAACDRAPCMQVNLEFVYDLTPAKVDELLALMRSGAYTVAPMAQTDAPSRSWEVRQDEQVATGRKAPGATGVVSPNNAGGVGDRSGTIMLDNIINRNVEFYQTTNERAVRDSRAIVDAVDSNSETVDRAGH